MFINLSHHFWAFTMKWNQANLFSHCWKKKTPTKDIKVECTYSVAHDEYHENSFSITSGNSLNIYNELRTWTTFVDMVNNILGNHLAADCKWVEMLLKNLRILGTNMSIKGNFLLSYLHKFPYNYCYLLRPPFQFVLGSRLHVSSVN